MNNPSNDHPTENRTSECQPGVSTIMTTTICNVTYIYYTVTNALITPANALQSAFRPCQDFSSAWRPQWGSFGHFAAQFHSIITTETETIPRMTLTTTMMMMMNLIMALIMMIYWQLILMRRWHRIISIRFTSNRKINAQCLRFADI